MPRSISATDVKSSLRAFERAVKKAEDGDGKVDIAVLKKLAKSETKQTRAVFESCIDTLETRFAKKKTIELSCGTRVETTPPKALTARQATSVFAALIEAKSKGIDKIAGSDKRITANEAVQNFGRGLGALLAAAAAEGATSTLPVDRPPPRPRPPATPPTSGGSTGSVSCGGTTGGTAGAGC